MKKHMKIIPLALLLTALGVPAMAQQASSWINQDGTKSYPIDWKPDYNAGKRYVIGIHPYHMLHFGLKLDFEMELDKPGKYLQFGLMGYYAPYNKDSYYYENSEYFLGDGWQIFGGDTFDKLRGGGLSVGYKSIFGHRGWYYSGVLLFNYYDVDYQRVSYTSFVEDGLTFYRRSKGWENTKFYKPAVNANIGKHMALGKHVFLDGFVGVGYTYSFYDGPKRFSEMYEFGHRGFYVSGGCKLAVTWGGKPR